MTHKRYFSVVSPSSSSSSSSSNSLCVFLLLLIHPSFPSFFLSHSSSLLSFHSFITSYRQWIAFFLLQQTWVYIGLNLYSSLTLVLSLHPKRELLTLKHERKERKESYSKKLLKSCLILLFWESCSSCSLFACLPCLAPLQRRTRINTCLSSFCSLPFSHSQSTTAAMYSKPV